MDLKSDKRQHIQLELDFSIPGTVTQERCNPDKVPASSYRGYRFPEEVISQCVWLYFNFALSLREVELMMAFRGVQLRYETIRRWCDTFGASYAAKHTPFSPYLQCAVKGRDVGRRSHKRQTEPSRRHYAHHR